MALLKREVVSLPLREMVPDLLSGLRLTSGKTSFNSVSMARMGRTSKRKTNNLYIFYLRYVFGPRFDLILITEDQS